MAVVTDLTHLVLEAPRRKNVDTVEVDDQILEAHGKLTALDASKVVRERATRLPPFGARSRR